MTDELAPRQPAPRGVATALLTAIALLCAAAALVIGTSVAGADTSISITGGGCPANGGGTSYCYNPESANAMTGAKVTWTGSGHTASLCSTAACPGAPASSASCDDFNVSVNGSGSYTFTHPGTCYYYCMIHGYAAMHAVITVAQAATPAPATPTPTPAPASSSTPPPATVPSTGGSQPTSPPATSSATAPAPSVSVAAPSTPSASSAAVATTGSASGGGSFPILIPIILVVAALSVTAAILVRRRASV